jgi:carbonic anhydrase
MLSAKSLWEKPLRARYQLLTLCLALTLVFLPACKKQSSAKADKKGSSTEKVEKKTSHHEHDDSQNHIGDAKEALAALMEGNERYIDGSINERDLSHDKLEELAKGQHPFAIVLACSDSRVSPELVFDQSLGDIFVVRVAGNIVDKAAMGSIEYAAEHLHAPLIFVMGHEKCGAVTAATDDKGAPGNIQFLINEIRPAVKKAKGLGGDLVAKSIDENVRNVIETMPARSQILTELIKENKLKLAGGTYSLSNGKVKILVEPTSGIEHQEKAEHKEEKEG